MSRQGTFCHGLIFFTRKHCAKVFGTRREAFGSCVLSLSWAIGLHSVDPEEHHDTHPIRLVEMVKTSTAWLTLT